MTQSNALCPASFYRVHMYMFNNLSRLAIVTLRELRFRAHVTERETRVLRCVVAQPQINARRECDSRRRGQQAAGVGKVKDKKKDGRGVKTKAEALSTSCASALRLNIDFSERTSHTDARARVTRTWRDFWPRRSERSKLFISPRDRSNRIVREREAIRRDKG